MNVSNVSAETNKGTDDGALYTVWVDDAIVTGFMGNHSDASELANSYLELGYANTTLMLENADEVYGL